MAVKLEVCVDAIAGVHAAQAGGADRVELCAALSEGGLTPSWGLMQEAAKAAIPSYAMIRPRAGLFGFDRGEKQVMLADAIAARNAGLAGIVIGIQAPDGGLDAEAMRPLMDVGLPVTLHRVIDIVPDWRAGLDVAMELGIERVLTSGGAARAVDGAARLAQMVAHAGSDLSIMAGSGVSAQNVADLIAATGVSEVHASCAVTAAGDPAFSNFDPSGGRKVTDVGMVNALKITIT